MIVGKEDIEQFQLKVEKGFDVTGSAVGKGFVAFNVTPKKSHDESYESVFNEFKGEDQVPLYRKTQKGLRIFVIHKKQREIKKRPRLNLILFILTSITVAIVGYLEYADRDVTKSIMFVIALMGILGVHELGHFLTARKRKIDATLPYFIPAPPPFPFGTLGALIFMGSPAKNRNSLLELGLAGPLAGFLLSVPAAIIGLKYSSLAPLSVGLEDEMIFPMPLILMLIFEYIIGGPLDPETVIQPHPIAMAAWIGFFVTALNLLPVGQFDGGHVIRALLPIHYRKIFLTTLFIFPPVLVIFFSPLWLFYWPMWLLLVIVMWVLTRIDHPGPLNNVSEMDSRKKIIGALIFVLLLILCFPPVPPIPTEILSSI